MINYSTSKFCISTLLHNHEQASSLFKTVVQQFVKNTALPSNIKNSNNKVDWYVRLNGHSLEIENTLRNLNDVYKHSIDWHVDVGQNIGVGAGINYLNKMCSEYEYNLFLEGDWICLDPEVANIPSNWLQTSLNLLEEHPTIGQVFLRRHVSDKEDRQYGMHDWFLHNKNPKIVVRDNVEFVQLKHGRYTNNPVLRRQKDFFNVGIFPLNEYYDCDGKPTEIKITTNTTGPDWGKAEIEAFDKGKDLETLWLWPGIFHHVRNIGVNDITAPCSNCKYGFLNPSNWFCASCSTVDEFYELQNHTTRGIETVLDKFQDKDFNEKELQSLVDFLNKNVTNPTIPPKALLSRLYNPKLS